MCQCLAGRCEPAAKHRQTTRVEKIGLKKTSLELGVVRNSEVSGVVSENYIDRLTEHPMRAAESRSERPRVECAAGMSCALGLRWHCMDGLTERR